MAVVVVFFYLYWGNVVLWLKRTSTKKLVNRISYQIWYKGCLKGNFGRGVQICEGRSISTSGFGPGGSKSAVTPAVPSNLYSEILYMMILQKILKQWRHPHTIFSQKNLVQFNSDRMALSILRVSLKVAKWRHSLTVEDIEQKYSFFFWLDQLLITLCA